MRLGFKVDGAGGCGGVGDGFRRARDRRTRHCGFGMHFRHLTSPVELCPVPLPPGVERPARIARNPANCQQPLPRLPEASVAGTAAGYRAPVRRLALGEETAPRGWLGEDEALVTLCRDRGTP